MPGGEQRDAQELLPGDRPLVEAEHAEPVEHDREAELARDDGGRHAAGAELAHRDQRGEHDQDAAEAAEDPVVPGG